MVIDQLFYDAVTRLESPGVMEATYLGVLFFPLLCTELNICAYDHELIFFAQRLGNIF